jgi:hypothetical protein
MTRPFGTYWVRFEKPQSFDEADEVIGVWDGIDWYLPIVGEHFDDDEVAVLRPVGDIQ